MNNEDYTELYNLLLNGLNKYDCSDNLQLFNKLKAENKWDVFLAMHDISENRLAKEINRVLLNMKDDGLIRASVTPVKIGQYIFTFDGLTTKGHNYLAAVNAPKAWRKIKMALHDEGIPLTPQSAGKVMGKLFF